ncbi:MAG: hypothetical protein H7A41_04670 [Chlamydiales bacterium]|nr:hypothetical protein [Chlamydiia bacterium]MCP5504428.1 hypothetical protein [Chlamydiales bacterium]
MEIIKVIQVAICQNYRRHGIYSALKLAWKIHSFLAAFRTVYSLIPPKYFQKRITCIFHNPADSEENHVKDLKCVQLELLPFYNNMEEITAEKVHKFVETINQRFFQYFIDSDKDLLVEIRTRKLQMIIRGEKAYIQRVEDSVKNLGPGYRVYLIMQRCDQDPLIGKIRRYSKDRLAMRVDIPYQRSMLESFFEWFAEITGPLALPASAAHYIT